MKLVSIIIPTYNRKAYLETAVDSVLKQTFSNFELIIIDDGSNDGTDSLANSLWQKDERIKYIYQSNKGVSSARNMGIKNARGELIGFLDSDDYWLEDKLEIQTEFFDSHPECDICHTDEKWIKNGVFQKIPKKYQKEGGDIFEKALELCAIGPSTVLMKREIFDKIGLFDESLPACEDYDMWLRITAKYKVFLLPQDLVVKRGGHPDQLSMTIPHLDKYRIMAIEKIIKSGELSEKQRNLAISMFKRKCEIYAQGCLKYNKHNEYDHYLNLSNKYFL